MNILIVDDRPGNLKLLRVQLEVEGHRVISAATGVEALAVLEREKVDAIISDILMPQMDGYRLCYEVRKNQRFQALPFVFYTATYTSPGDEKLCLELGGDKYLRKPASAEEISSALRDAVNLTEQRTLNRVGSLSETDVMKEYSERLVSKLEEKNIELQQTLEKLHVAHEEILTLNRNLEQRVEERTVELEAANKELEAFSHSISHDLRAPLRVIDGFIRILQEDHAAQLPHGAIQKLERIGEHAIRMRQLIDGLLDFSRLSRHPLEKRTVSIAAIVQRVLEELQPGKNVTITVADLPDCQADATLLRQVFVNLLANALKYSRQRDPAVIEIGWREAQGSCVYFVRDNGAGFDMRYAAKLFGVFQRLHRQDEFEGTGIGLSIVQRIIHRHGGRIWAESAPDQGAIFFFTVEPASPALASP